MKSDPCIYIYKLIDGVKNPATEKGSMLASQNKDKLIFTIYVDDLLPGV